MKIVFGRPAAWAPGISEFEKEAAQRPLSRRRSPWEDLPWIVWDRRMNLTMIDAWLDAHASPIRSRIFVDVSSLLVQEHRDWCT